MKNFIVVFAFLLLSIVFVSGCVQQTPPVVTTSTVAGSGGTTTTAGSTNYVPQVREFNITAKQFSFDPNIIIVNKSDTVKLNIMSVDVTHGIAIPDFNINERLEPGNEVHVQFVADKTGRFSFFCNVFCGEGHREMTGELVVNQV